MLIPQRRYYPTLAGILLWKELRLPLVLGFAQSHTHYKAGDRISHTQLIISYLTHIFLGRMPTNLHPKPPRFLNEPITMTFIIHIKPITRCPSVRVIPTIFVPSKVQIKCSDHCCLRGLNKETSS